MQRTKFLSPLLVSVALIFFSALSHSSTALNGVAIHSELGKDKFLAGLFVESTSSDARSILLADKNKRIEIRVIPEKLPSRRFKRMWIEGMAINASSLELTQQAQNMADFSNMLKVKLIKGDILSVERRQRDVSVKLNGILLGTIKNKTFFDLLLRTWIGPVPLSSAFRDNILAAGNIDKTLLSQFNSTSPSDSRISSVRSSVKQIAAEKLEEASAAVGLAAQAKPKVDVPKIKIDKPTIKPIEPKQAAPKIADKPKTTPKPTPKPIPEPKPTEKVAIKPKPAAPEKTNENQVPFSLDDAISALLGEEKPIETEAAEQDNNDNFTAESLLTQTMYIARLQKWTYQYLRYPPRAESRGQEGNVRLKVSINREGKVTNIVVVEESEFNSLTNEARRAVKRASPFPAVPDAVPGDPYHFTLPIAFKLK